MNPLPPLRTVRDATPASATSATPTQLATPPPRPAPPALDAAGLPRPAREFLAELVAAGVLPADTVPDFVARMGDRGGLLSTRERTADALAGLGYLTPYQATRATAGQLHGLVLGGYRVLDRLAGGSVGVVFRGEHTVLKRPAALKVMAVDDTTRPELLQRFLAESCMLAGLSHPNVVTAYDAGVLPPGGPGLTALYYLALELVEGGDLEQYVVGHGPQPVGLACEWGRQAACGLRAAHAAGLIHRDVKPSNLLLTRSRRVKLIDFGLARDFASHLTGPRTLIGSVEFMPPEQVTDPTTAGPEADVYGLAAALFWVLTGHLPYPKIRNLAEALEVLKSTPPRRLREVNPDLPDGLDELLARMLARNPADRPGIVEAAEGLARFAAPTSHPSQDRVPLILDEDSEAGELRAAVAQLEDAVSAAEEQAAEARAAVLTTLAALAALQPGDGIEFQDRITRTVRVLAAGLAPHPDWSTLADPRTVEEWGRAAAVLDFDHAVLDSLLFTLAQRHGPALPFLRSLVAVVRHHTERWDGTGTPDGLSAAGIPPPARFVAVALAYYQLRADHPDQPHGHAMETIESLSGQAFDPAIVEVLHGCGKELDRVYGYEPPADPPDGAKRPNPGR